MAITLTFSVGASAGPAPAVGRVASDGVRICAQEEAMLFICETNRQDKFVALCAVEEETGKRWSAVQYRFGKSDDAEFVYPADARQGASKLFFSHEERGTFYHVSIRFQSGGFTYRIESSANEASTPIGDGSAGVTVTNAAGKTVAKIACTERPTMYPAYLQMALACDPENPHGKAGCADKPPTVQGVKPVKKTK